MKDEQITKDQIDWLCNDGKGQPIKWTVGPIPKCQGDLSSSDRPMQYTEKYGWREITDPEADEGEWTYIVGIFPKCGTKMNRVAINPHDPHIGRVFLDLLADSPSGHPQTIMARLAQEHSFEILDSVPQSLFDGWDFWIRFDEPPELPDYFRPVPWKPVGQV